MKYYTLSVFRDNVRIAYGTVPGDYDIEALEQQATDWIKQDNPHAFLWDYIRLDSYENKMLFDNHILRSLTHKTETA